MFDFDNAKLADLIAQYNQTPGAYEANLFLGLHLATKRTGQLDAERFLLKALSFGQVDEYTPLLLRRLAWVQNLKGNFEMTANLLKKLVDFGHGDSFVRMELADAYFASGAMKEAFRLYAEVLEPQFRRAETHSKKLNEPITHLLEPDVFLTKYLGEMAENLEGYVKARKLGWHKGEKAKLCLHKDRVANADYADYWRDHIELIDDPADIKTTKERYHDCRLLVYGHQKKEPGKYWHRDIAKKVIQLEWERRGLPPLLSLKDEHREKGRELLGEYGMPNDAWFVCFHVRDPESYQENSIASSNFHRHADIKSYLPALKEITDRGGWVVRIGDSRMQPLPQRENVIDLANRQEEHNWIDVFAVAASRFFFGMATGPVSLAENFGIPILGSNWLAGGSWLARKGDIFLPKLYRYKENGNLVPLSEMLRPPFYNVFTPMVLEKHGLEVVNNCEADLAEAVVEMLDALENKHVYSREDDEGQSRFWKLADVFNLGFKSRIAKGFLNNNRDILS